MDINRNNMNEKTQTNNLGKNNDDEKETVPKRVYYMGRRNFYKRNNNSITNQNNIEKSHEIQIPEKKRKCLL